MRLLKLVIGTVPCYLLGALASAQGPAQYTVGTTGFGVHNCAMVQPTPAACTAHYGAVGPGYSFDGDFVGLTLGGMAPIASAQLIGTGVNSGVPNVSGSAGVTYYMTVVGPPGGSVPVITVWFAETWAAVAGPDINAYAIVGSMSFSSQPGGTHHDIETLTSTSMLNVGSTVFLPIGTQVHMDTTSSGQPTNSFAFAYGLADPRVFIDPTFPDHQLYSVALSSNLACGINVTQNPLDTTTTPGAAAVFQTAASDGAGGSLSYRWHRITGPLSDGGGVSGSTTPTLTIANIGATEWGMYYCVISNGVCSTTSQPAQLIMDCGTVITGPQSAAVHEGDDAHVSVSVAADPQFGQPTYQWRFNGSPLSDDGQQVVGATTPTLTLAAVTLGQAGAYDCEVRNDCGKLRSSVATLAILPPCSADFNGDGDVGTDADIEAFFACLAGNCCASCASADFNGDGDVGTDADIESFFRVLSGGPC